MTPLGGVRTQSGPEFHRAGSPCGALGATGSVDTARLIDPVAIPSYRDSDTVQSAGEPAHSKLALLAKEPLEFHAFRETTNKPALRGARIISRLDTFVSALIYFVSVLMEITDGHQANQQEKGDGA